MNVKKGEIVLVLGVFLAIGIFIFFREERFGITGSAIGILPDLNESFENNNLLVNEKPIITDSNGVPVIEPFIPDLAIIVPSLSNENSGLNHQSSEIENNFLSDKETLGIASIGIQGTASTTSCGTVTTNLSLNSAVSSGGSCFNISANNITIDCKGFRITYGSTGTGGYGINNSEGYDNLIIKNCVIVEGNVSGNGQIAIYLNTTVNTTIENNTINTSGASAFGIYLTNSNVTTLYLNTITTNGSNGYGINLAGTNGSRVLYNNITTSGSQGYALYLNNFSGNNTFTTNYLFSGTAFEILDETADDIINYLIYNDTFGEIRWLDNGTGTFLRNLTINGSIGLGTNIFFDYNIIAVNSSAFSPLRINTTVANVSFFSLSYGLVREVRRLNNFTPSSTVTIDSGTNCNATSCPISSYDNTTGILRFNTTSFSSFAVVGNLTCSRINRDLRLDRNITASGDCFNLSTRTANILMGNFEIDCRGYSIIGNGSGRGIFKDLDNGDSLVGLIENVTVKNCSINQFEYGIFINGASTGSFFNVFSSTIHNVTVGIAAANALGVNNIFRYVNNTIYNTSSSGSGISIPGSGDSSILTIIANNTLYNNPRIAIDGGTTTTVQTQNNNISNNNVGLDANRHMTSENDFFYNNTIALNCAINSTYFSPTFLRNTVAIDLATIFQYDCFINNPKLTENNFDIRTGGSVSANITLLNASSLNLSKISIGLTEVYYKWYVDVNITDSFYNPLNNATVTIFDSRGAIDDLNQTNSNGISRLIVTERYISSNRSYFLTPGKVQAKKDNYTYNQTDINLVNLTYLGNISIPLTLINCGSTVNYDLDIGNNYNCEEGLTVGRDSITIDGKWFNLSGLSTGIGLTIIDKSNITIKRLTVRNFSTGISAQNVNLSEFRNIRLINNTIGIRLNNSQNNSFYDSVFGNNTNVSIFVESTITTNNSFINLSVEDLNDINVTGNGVFSRKWYVDVNVTHNSTFTLEGVDVFGYITATGILESSAVSVENGIGRLLLSELQKTANGINYLTPHNVNISFIFQGNNLTNGTTINLSQTNNMVQSLRLTIACDLLSTSNQLESNVTLCPTTFSVANISITNSNVNITCIKTKIKGDDSTTLVFINSVNNIVIDGCNLQTREKEIVSIDGSTNVKIRNSNFTGWDTLTGYNPEIAIHCLETTGLSIINNSFKKNIYGVYLDTCNHNNISLNTFLEDEISIRFINSDNNTVINNSFIKPDRGLWFTDNNSVNNSFYHNVFSDAEENIDIDAVTNYFNRTIGGFTQGNEYSDYCDKGVDLNSDGYADNFTSLTNRDWPYNKTVAGTKIRGSAEDSFVDYGPRIIACPPSQVQLGSSSSSSSGGSSRPAAAAAAAPSPPAPAATGGRTQPPPTPPPEQTYSSASETAQFLERQVTTQDLLEKNIKVTVVLENTGTKKMLLFPEIFQKIGDPFFIVTRKTLGFEGSLFTKLSALSYSRDPVAGRLLKATIVNPEQIILNPGEKIEKVIEIDEGLPIPREIKIQFTTLGETVFEEEVTVTQKAFSGTALDLDKEHQSLDIYAVIVPEELTKELEEYYAGSPTGAAIAPKKNVVGFAQQVIQQLTPQTSENQYQLELGLYEPGSSEAFFTDLYGPYELKENQTFIFAQQLKYNPAIYNGNYQLRTKIYRGSSLLVKNQFDVNLGEQKRSRVWQWVTVQIVLVALGVLVYMKSRKGRKEPKYVY